MFFWLGDAEKGDFWSVLELFSTLGRWRHLYNTTLLVGFRSSPQVCAIAGCRLDVNSNLEDTPAQREASCEAFCLFSVSDMSKNNRGGGHQGHKGSVIFRRKCLNDCWMSWQMQMLLALGIWNGSCRSLERQHGEADVDFQRLDVDRKC